MSLDKIFLKYETFLVRLIRSNENFRTPTNKENYTNNFYYTNSEDAVKNSHN